MFRTCSESGPEIIGLYITYHILHVITYYKLFRVQ